LAPALSASKKVAERFHSQPMAEVPDVSDAGYCGFEYRFSRYGQLVLPHVGGQLQPRAAGVELVEGDSDLGRAWAVFLPKVVLVRKFADIGG
jgi:hypothetical protein